MPSPAETRKTQTNARRQIATSVARFYPRATIKTNATLVATALSRHKTRLRRAEKFNVVPVAGVGKSMNASRCWRCQQSRMVVTATETRSASATDPARFAPGLPHCNPGPAPVRLRQKPHALGTSTQQSDLLPPPLADHRHATPCETT